MAATDISHLDAEYLALTEGCGLLDRSERGKLALTGSGSKEFLAGQVTNDTEALASGSGCYAAFLTPKGKMLGDLRILDVGDELLLDTERVAQRGGGEIVERGLEVLAAKARGVPGHDHRAGHQAPTSAWIAPGPSAVLP